MYIPKEELEKCGLLEPKPIQVNTPVDQLSLYDKIDALSKENERLKAENAMLNEEREKLKETIRKCDFFTLDFYKGLCERLRKENAKLKCLALHLFSKLFVYMNIHYHTLFKCALDDEYEFEQTACASIKYKRKCEKTNELLIKYDEAYRKAKNELKDGK